MQLTKPLIPLTKGKFAQVDEADYEQLIKHNWCTSYYGYAVRRKHGGGIIFMHREILNAGDNEIDHINGDKLDNRRSNLRTATCQENILNRPVRRDNKLGIKGVRFLARAKSSGVFQARINKEHIGMFPTLEQAISAYNKKAIVLHGEFAKLSRVRG